MAAITKRKDGWYVQIRRKGFAPIYKTLPTKAEATAWAREHEARIDQRCAPMDLRNLRTTKLSDIIERYRREVTPRKRSAASEDLRLRKMLRAPMAAVSMATLSPAVISAYRDERLLTVKPGTVRRELSLLCHMIDRAMREWDLGIIQNPVKMVSRPVANDSRDRRLGAGELVRLKKALVGCRNPILEQVVMFAIETALRRGEIVDLDWRHLNLAQRTVHIPHTKTGKPRTIPLTDGALAILDALPSRTGRVFPVSTDALKNGWNRLRIRAGLPDLRFHDLRHESISRFAEMGLTTPELALISGHRDIRMLSRYTHLRPADLALKLAGMDWSSQHKGAAA